MAVEEDASEESKAAPQSSVMPRATDIRNAKARGAESGRVGIREAVGIGGKSSDIVFNERRRASEGLG